MHRSMDLIREILLAMEASADGFTQPIMLKGYSEEEIGYHCLLLSEAELILAADSTSISSMTPTAVPIRITWSGYEFLENARDEKIWSRAKQSISSASFSVLDKCFSPIRNADIGVENSPLFPPPTPTPPSALNSPAHSLWNHNLETQARPTAGSAAVSPKSAVKPLRIALLGLSQQSVQRRPRCVS